MSNFQVTKDAVITLRAGMETGNCFFVFVFLNKAQTRNYKQRLQTCSPEQSIPFIVTMDSTLGLADLFLCSNLTAKCVTLMLSSLSLSLPVLLVHRQKVFQFMKCDLNRNVHWKLGAAPQSCWHSDRDFNDSFMFDLWDPSAQKAHCFSQECGKAACV